MKERITLERLERLAKIVSRELGVPCFIDSDGNAKYSLVVTEDNRRLVGYLSKRELYDQVHAFRVGVEETYRHIAAMIKAKTS